jgi:hypothetical protein
MIISFIMLTISLFWILNNIVLFYLSTGGQVMSVKSLVMDWKTGVQLQQGQSFSLCHHVQTDSGAPNLLYSQYWDFIPCLKAARAPI